MGRFMVLPLSVLMVLGIFGLAAASFVNISPDQAYENLMSGSIEYLVDCRTPQEWSGLGYLDPRPGKKLSNTPGHPGYDSTYGDFLEIGINVFNISYQLFDYGHNARVDNPFFFDDFGAIFDYNDPVAILCHSGARSCNAAEELAAMGYSNLFNIVGGFEGRTKGACDSYCFGTFCQSIGDLCTCLGWTDYNLPIIDEDSTGAYHLTSISIPGTILLLGSGLVGIIGVRRKRFRS